MNPGKETKKDTKKETQKGNPTGTPKGIEKCKSWQNAQLTYGSLAGPRMLTPLAYLFCDLFGPKNLQIRRPHVGRDV